MLFLKDITATEAKMILISLWKDMDDIDLLAESAAGTSVRRTKQFSATNPACTWEYIMPMDLKPRITSSPFSGVLCDELCFAASE